MGRQLACLAKLIPPKALTTRPGQSALLLTVGACSSYEIGPGRNIQYAFFDKMRSEALDKGGMTLSRRTKERITRTVSPSIRWRGI